MFSGTFSVIFCYTLKVLVIFFFMVKIAVFGVFSMSIRYVASKPYVDENKIAIWGWVSLHQLCDKVLQIPL